MDSYFEETLVHGSKGELQELKAWLFKENIRVVTAAKELEEMQEQFLNEKIHFREEMEMLNQRISREREKLKEDNQYFEKKMEILKNGFSKLDIDRRRLDKEWAKLATEKKLAGERSAYDSVQDVSIFFKGVRTPIALKKRYKDLIKIFHPDNVAGDKDIIQRINKEYEALKVKYEDVKQA